MKVGLSLFARLALCLIVGPVCAQAGYLQSGNNAGPISGLTTTVALTGVTAGSTIVIAVTMKSENRSISTLTDSQSQTVTFRDGQSNGNNGEAFEVWTLSNANSGSHTFTITFDSSSQTGSHAMALEYGSVLSAAYDVSASAQGTASTSVTVGPTATTNQADETVIAVGRSTTASRPFSTPSGFTQQVALDTTRFVAWDKTVSSTGTQSATLAVTGGNSDFEAWIGTLKNSGGGGGSTVRNLMLMGVGP